MKCAVCGKETTISDDGGIAILMAVCYGHSTSLLNNSYCRECCEALVKKPLIELNNVPGMEIPRTEE